MKRCLFRMATFAWLSVASVVVVVGLGVNHDAKVRDAGMLAAADIARSVRRERTFDAAREIGAALADVNEGSFAVNGDTVPSLELHLNVSTAQAEAIARSLCDRWAYRQYSDMLLVYVFSRRDPAQGAAGRCVVPSASSAR